LIVSPFLTTAELASFSFFFTLGWSFSESDLDEVELGVREGASRDGVSRASDPLLRTGVATAFLRFSEAPPSLRCPESLWLG
jgi:hypothetical protein